MAVSCAQVRAQPLAETGRETGIDVGVKVVLLPADGDAVETPRPSRRAERSLVKCQRRVSKRVKGSPRRRKVIGVLARAHQQVRRQRADFQHQTARALVRQDATLSVAAMHPANLRRRPEPQPEGNGGYEHTGASRKAALSRSQPIPSRRRLEPVAFAPRLQGSRRRQASGSGLPGVHPAGVVQGVWRAHLQAPERAHPRLPQLRS